MTIGLGRCYGCSRFLPVLQIESDDDRRLACQTCVWVGFRLYEEMTPTGVVRDSAPERSN